MRLAPRLLLSSLFLLPLSATLGATKPKGNPPPPPPPAPMHNNSALQADQKALEDARTAFNKAQHDLDDATAKLTAEFEKSPDVLEAKKNRDAALATEQAARKAVLATLAADPAYKSAAAAEARARAQLDELRAAQAPHADLDAKSDELLQLGGNTSALERKALEADPTCSAAQSALAAANAKLAQLHAAFKDSLKTSDTLADKRKARDDAQEKLTAAQTKLKSSPH